MAFFYSFADLILVTTKDFKKEIKKYFNLQSVVHRQSLDIEGIKKKSKVKINFNFFKKFDGLKIINIGRLTYQKKPNDVIESFCEINKI